MREKVLIILFMLIAITITSSVCSLYFRSKCETPAINSSVKTLNNN